MIPNRIAKLKPRGLVRGRDQQGVSGSLVNGYSRGAADLAAQRTFFGYLEAFTPKQYSALGKVITVPVVVGDLVIVAFSVAGSLVAASIADNASGGTNTYSEIGSGAGYTSPIHGHVWYAVAKATETLTITVTSSASTSACTYVHVVTGADTTLATVLDQGTWDADEGARSTAHTSASITNTNASDYIFSFWFNDDAGGTYQENGTGFTPQISRNATAYGATFDKIVTATGSYSQDVLTSASTYTGNIVASFKAYAAPVGSNFGQICIGETWHTISEVQIVIAGAWHNVTEIQIVQGGAWHSLTA